MNPITPAAAAAVLLAVLGAALTTALPGCAPCDDGACDVIAQPRHASQIDQGIVGAVAYRSDVTANGCTECTYADTELRVWIAPQPITSQAQATSLAASSPKHVIAAHHTYEQQLEIGDYLVCQGDVCAAVRIEDDELITVNVKTRYGPPSLVVFEPDGGEQGQELVFQLGGAE